MVSTLVPADCAKCRMCTSHSAVFWIPTAKAPAATLNMLSAAAPIMLKERWICFSVSKERFLTRFSSVTNAAVDALRLMISSPIVGILLSSQRYVTAMDDAAHRQGDFFEQRAHLLGRGPLIALLYGLREPRHDVCRLHNRVVFACAMHVHNRADDQSRAPIGAMFALDVQFIERAELPDTQPADLPLGQAEMESSVRPEFQAATAGACAFGSACVSVTSAGREASG